VHSHPDPLLFVLEDIDVVVPASDRPELASRHVLQAGRRLDAPCRVVVEEIVIDVLSIGSSDSKRQTLPNVIHDRSNISAHISRITVEPDGLISTGDIETDSRGADLVLVGDDASYRYCVSEMMVCHEGAVFGAPGTVFHLIDGVVQRLSPDGDLMDELHCVVQRGTIAMDVQGMRLQRTLPLVGSGHDGRFVSKANSYKAWIWSEEARQKRKGHHVEANQVSPWLRRIIEERKLGTGDLGEALRSARSHAAAFGPRAVAWQQHSKAPSAQEQIKFQLRSPAGL